MGIVKTSSKKEQLKKASVNYLGTFKTIVKGLTETNKKIEVEERQAHESIDNLRQDLKDYDSIKQENSSVIEGLNNLLGIKIKEDE